jgi:hypothetical protein
LLPEHEEYIPQEALLCLQRKAQLNKSKALLAAQGTAICRIGLVCRVATSLEEATSPVFQKKDKKIYFFKFRVNRLESHCVIGVYAELAVLLHVSYGIVMWSNFYLLCASCSKSWRLAYSHTRKRRPAVIFNLYHTLPILTQPAHFYIKFTF